MKRLLLVSLVFVACDFLTYSQQSNLDGSKHYIKIIIDSEISQQQQEQINATLNQIAGVETARMDNTTGLFLGIYAPNDVTSGQTFLNWFSNHGYVIKCYYDAIYTPGGMINLSKTSCP